jgi:hypothetical protein
MGLFNLLGNVAGAAIKVAATPVTATIDIASTDEIMP